VSRLFIRLGILNVRRQLARSVLVILTLALAAISLTYSLSYQHITPPRVSQFLDKFVGGEILVAPLRWAGQKVTDVTAAAEYEYARLTASGLSWLQWFYPELYREGFWSKRGQSPTEFFSQDDLARLADFPGVQSVTVTPFLPAMLEMRDDNGSFLTPLLLTPQGERLSQYACAEYQGDLRLPLPGGIAINDALDLPPTTDLPQPGSTVRLRLPHAMGTTAFSQARLSGVELQFLRYLQFPTRPVSWDVNQPPETGRFRGPLSWVDPNT